MCLCIPGELGRMGLYLGETELHGLRGQVVVLIQKALPL